MKDWDEMSTNTIVLEIAELKQRHEAIKREILILVETLESVEKDFHEANKIVHKRLNR